MYTFVVCVSQPVTSMFKIHTIKYDINDVIKKRMFIATSDIDYRCMPNKIFNKAFFFIQFRKLIQTRK
jgi:hypothetical protein